MLNQRNSKKQGDVGLGAAIGYFTKMGYTVAVPLTESQRYDLIVEIDGDLKKVEVKTTTYKRNGNFKVLLSTQGGNQSFNKITYFDKNSVDFLFVVTEENNLYLIPSKFITQKKELTLNDQTKEYKI